MATWTPKRDFDEIRRITMDLQKARSPLITRMLDVQRIYDADLVIPLPELKDEPQMPSLVAMQMTDVIDGLARRASSVRPMVFSPSKDIYDPVQQAYAVDRVRVLQATYAQSGWILQRRRKERHSTAYETCSLLVEPDFVDGMPKLRVRSPLESYPEQRAQETMEPAEHVAFITRHSGFALRARFVEAAAENGGPITSEHTEELWDVVEWHDSDQIMYGLVGPVHYEGDHVNERYQRFGGPWMPLTPSVQNKAGVCLAYVPQGVSLHRIGNRLNRLIGNIEWQNRLMALDVIAQEKAIFPDMYVMSKAGNTTPTLIEGAWHDGREGIMNVIEGGDAIGTINQNPDRRTSDTLDRLQREFMRSSGLDPMMYGESRGSAMRTGRALNAMAETSIDPFIQELHEADEVWMAHVNEGILRSYQGWWGSKKYTMFSRWPGDSGTLEFTPNVCIDQVYDNTVEYAIAGADLVQVTQILGSMLGSDTISAETFQRLHPMIKNPGAERTLIEREKLDRALLEGLQQQVITGQMPASVFARIRKKYSEGDTTLVDALVEVDDEIRQEQLAAQQAAEEQAAQQQAAMPNDLNAMMGMAAGPAAAAPGALPPGVGQPTGPAPGPGGPVADMRALLSRANPTGG